MTDADHRQEARRTTDLRWFRLFPSKWEKTRGLSAADKGVFIELLIMMHVRREPLPNDAKRLARACGTTTAAFQKTLGLLLTERLVVQIGHGLWSADIQAEIENQQSRSENASKNASKRYGKSEQKQGQNSARAHRDKNIDGEGSPSESPSMSHTSSQDVGDASPSGASPTRFVFPGKVFESKFGRAVVDAIYPGTCEILFTVAASGKQVRQSLPPDYVFYATDPSISRRSAEIPAPQPASSRARMKRAAG